MTDLANASDADLLREFERRADARAETLLREIEEMLERMESLAPDSRKWQSLFDELRNHISEGDTENGRKRVWFIDRDGQSDVYLWVESTDDDEGVEEDEVGEVGEVLYATINYAVEDLNTLEIPLDQERIYEVYKRYHAELSRES
jgi:hypothetical protein